MLFASSTMPHFDVVWHLFFFQLLDNFMEPSLFLFPTIHLLTITEDGDISLQQFGLQDGSGLFVWNGVTVSVFKHLLYTYITIYILRIWLYVD